MAAHRVAVVVPPDFTLFELGVAVEAFARPRPGIEVEWYDVRVCSARAGAVSAMGGLFGASIAHGLEAVEQADTVVVPQADAVGSPAAPEVLDALRAAHGRGTRLVAFCTGAFALAEAGVLDGRRATTHWRYTGELARRYPEIAVDPDVLYVDDGQVLTSAGTAAGIDLSLHIIRRDHGAHVARLVARHMVVAPHREGGQAQFVMTPVPDAARRWDGVAHAMQFALEHLDRDLGLAELAATALMSPRNFSRRFREATGTTPIRWLKHQRLTRARELLEETDLPVERVAARTGFGSAVTLRQQFAQSLYTSPSSYRRAFHESGGVEPAGWSGQVPA